MQHQQERGFKIRVTILQIPRPVKKDGEEMLQVLEQIPLQPMVRQVVPCSQWRSIIKQVSISQSVKNTPQEQVDVP